MIIGVQKVIADEVPEARTGAAQGLAYFANGLSIAAITLASGPLYSALGIYGTIPMIGVAAIATGSILLARHQPQRSAVGGETSEPA
jgi:PPP family 3-phenylpropionic acid transporter